jgi:hypothetical protein
MKIWTVPQNMGKPHGLKYSLVYIQREERLIGYDNAEGKGDHKHFMGKEIPYRFIDIDTLIQDFYDVIERLREFQNENKKN